MRLTAGTSVDVRFEYDNVTETALAGALALRLGTEPADLDEDALIAQAAEAASKAEAALVVVGTNSLVESEGYDR